MKIFKLIIITLLLLNTQSFAQRYKTAVFDSVIVSSNLQYGFNFNVNNDSTNLFVDVYQPANDTVGVKRPLIILAHGGFFIQGSKNASDVTTLCTELAKRGYVCASIQYRLGINIFSGKPLEEEFSNAVWRGTQDGRAAVRWFRKDVSIDNTFSLDTSKIYIGGISAGGVLGMQLAFLDNEAELSQTMVDTALVGGIEGSSGNEGYSWNVKGVINLCGAIGNVNFMLNNQNIKLCSMHGNDDQTVPYGTGYFYFFGSPITILQGSFSIDSTAKLNNTYSDFYTFEGAPHVPFSSNAQYMDTTINYIASSLYNQFMGNVPMLVNEVYNLNSKITLYPNPSNTIINFSMAEPININEIEIQNAHGQKMLTAYSNQVNIAELSNGIYFAIIKTDKGIVSKKFIKN